MSPKGTENFDRAEESNILNSNFSKVDLSKAQKELKDQEDLNKNRVSGKYGEKMDRIPGSFESKINE